jgi:pimeloyl-ACP methyl ester carboxylesterase
MLESTIALRCGRRLSYFATGPVDGFPVAYLHGALGSPRWRTPALEAVLDALRIRYVVVNRPGFCSSDDEPDRTVGGFARDLEEVADALGWDRFSVVGVSAGAPYALACAAVMPERLVATAAVSPFAPPGFAAPGRGVPVRYRTPLAFTLPGLGPALAAAALRASGLRRETPVGAMIADYLACCRPWGFEPAAVDGPVRIWHARHDRLVPLPHVLRLTAALPHGRLEVEPRGGHFFFQRRVTDILGSVVPGISATRVTPALAA